MPTTRRLLLLIFLSTVGGALFVPFVFVGIRGSGQAIPSLPLLTSLFTVGSGIVGGLCAWGGLRFADRAQLPMPLLRAWEQRQAMPAGFARRIVLASLLAGCVAGFGITAVVRFIHVPSNPGSLPIRLLTVFFAATVPEIFVHLFAMSGLQLLFRKTWLSILLSSVLFVLVFHSGQVGSPAITALVIAANFSFGTLTGWIYSRYGFEGAMLTHAVGHLILLGVN